MSIFGFSTEPTSGDFLPIIKYDARAGRIFRMDRTADGREPVDITPIFAAVFDLENIETGWMNFSGTAPDFKLVRMGEVLPVRPSLNHKNGIRLLCKLHPQCAGPDRPIREFSTSAKAALQGLEKLYLAYQQQKPGNGKLPIVALQGATPVRTGSGDKSSTNYVPTFTIVGWANRPSDLVYVPRGSSGPSQEALPLTQPVSTAASQAVNRQAAPASYQPPVPNGSGPPSTGATRVQPPTQAALQMSAEMSAEETNAWGGVGAPQAPAPATQEWPGETKAVGQPRMVPDADDFG